MSIQALLLGALLALLYSLGMAGLVYRVAGERFAQRAADAMALGVGATPFLAGLVTIAAIAALGKSSDAAYVALHLGFAGALMLLSAGSILSIGYGLCGLARTLIREARPLWRAVLRIETLLAAVALLFAIFSFLGWRRIYALYWQDMRAAYDIVKTTRRDRRGKPAKV